MDKQDVPDDIFKPIYDGLSNKEIINFSCTNKVQNERFYRLVFNVEMAQKALEQKIASTFSIFHPIAALFYNKTRPELCAEFPSSRVTRFMPCGKNGVAHFKETYGFENPFALQRIKDGESIESVLRNREEQINKIYEDNPTKEKLALIKQLFNCGEGIKEGLIEGLFTVDEASRFNEWNIKWINSSEFAETIAQYNLTKAQANRLAWKGFNPFMDERVKKAVEMKQCSIDAAIDLYLVQRDLLLGKKGGEFEDLYGRSNFCYFISRKVVRDAVDKEILTIDQALAIKTDAQLGVLTGYLGPCESDPEVFERTIAVWGLTNDEAAGMVMKGFNPFLDKDVQQALNNRQITKKDALDLPCPSRNRDKPGVVIKAFVSSDLSIKEIGQLDGQAQSLIESSFFERAIDKYNLSKAQVGRLILNHFQSDQNHRGANPFSIPDEAMQDMFDREITIDQIIDNRGTLK
jgi:hypothetical protein